MIKNFSMTSMSLFRTLEHTRYNEYKVVSFDSYLSTTLVYGWIWFRRFQTLRDIVQLVVHDQWKALNQTYVFFNCLDTLRGQMKAAFLYSQLLSWSVAHRSAAHNFRFSTRRVLMWCIATTHALDYPLNLARSSWRKFIFGLALITVCHIKLASLSLACRKKKWGKRRRSDGA